MEGSEQPWAAALQDSRLLCDRRPNIRSTPGSKHWGNNIKLKLKVCAPQHGKSFKNHPSFFLNLWQFFLIFSIFFKQQVSMEAKLR